MNANEVLSVRQKIYEVYFCGWTPLYGFSLNFLHYLTSFKALTCLV